MKTTIGFMGSSVIADGHIENMAYRIGEEVARRKATLITGATSGLPFAAARGAADSGGEVIGFSPALNRIEHLSYGLPATHHDLIVYTGLGFNGRNLLNIRASDGILFAGGSIGTLNEFTIAYAEDKIMGILEGSGGFCDQMRDWIQHLKRPDSRAIIHYNSDPVQLTDLVFESIYKQAGE